MAVIGATAAVEGPRTMAIPGLVSVVDLSAKQFFFVKLDGSNAGQVILPTDDGDICIGVLQNNPKGATGAPREAEVLSLGVTKIVVGNVDDLLTPGVEVSNDGSGSAQVATTGDCVQGIVVWGAAKGAVASIMLTSPYRKP